jgi:hypothetical protein
VFWSQAEQAKELVGLGIVAQWVIILALADGGESFTQAFFVLPRGEDSAVELGLKTEVVVEMIGTRDVFERFVVHRLLASDFGLTPEAF